MSLDIQNTKIDLINWLTSIEDMDLLQKIKSIQESELKEDWATMSADEKKSIEKGLADLSEGNFKLHSEAKKLYEKYL